MSHIVSLELKIKDLNALSGAAQRLGGQLVRDVHEHTYYGGKSKCDHIIRVPGVRYEIGVVKQPDGTFKLNLDTYGGHGDHDGHKLVEKFGDRLKKLSQAYAISVAKIQAKAKGWMCQEQALPNGSIRLCMTGV